MALTRDSVLPRRLPAMQQICIQVPNRLIEVAVVYCTLLSCLVSQCPQMPSPIIRSGCSTYPRHVSTNAASSAPSTTRWSADQLTAIFSRRSPVPSPRSTSHIHRARPSATIATPPPGTSRGIALSPAPTAPMLLTVSVPPRRGSSVGVSALGTCRPRYAKCLRVEAMLKTECLSTARTVGVYSPVGVDSATQMSEFGRTVSVGFWPSEVLPGVMEERKSGQACMALERVLRRTGRYVILS